MGDGPDGIDAGSVLERIGISSPDRRTIKQRKGSRKRKTQLTTSEIAKVADLHTKGLGQKEIARVIERSQCAVANTLKHLGLLEKSLESAKAYRDARDVVFTATEQRLIQSINDPSKHRAASLRDCAYAFKEIYHAGRLERGLSTSNSQQLRFTIDPSAANMQPSDIVDVSPTDNSSYNDSSATPPLIAEEIGVDISSSAPEQGGGGMGG